MAERKYDPEFEIEAPWDTYLGDDSILEWLPRTYDALTNYLTNEFEIFLAILTFIVLQLIVLNIYYHLAAYITTEQPQDHVHVLGKEVVILTVLLFVFWNPTTEELKQLLENQELLGGLNAEGDLTPAVAIWLLTLAPTIAATLVATLGLGAFVLGLTRYQASWEQSLGTGTEAKTLILRGLAVFAFCFITLGFQFIFYIPEMEVVFAS
ncbi:MAG: hypothetical protein ACE5OZ_11395 [Candidatus Heimdallarchaeota archaeon]